MNPFFASVLLFFLFSNALFAQKKVEKPIQPYFAIATGYAETSVGTGFPLNVDYQWRYKKIGIGVGFGVEYVNYKQSNKAVRPFEIGMVLPPQQYLLIQRRPYIFQATEQWFNLVPSLMGYYYLGKKKRWEGFFKTGIFALYNAWYDLNGLEYKVDSQMKIIGTGPIDERETKNSIDLQRINWLVGGGVLYKLNEKTALRMSSEVQWGRGISVLGGVVFKR